MPLLPDRLTPFRSLSSVGLDRDLPPVRRTPEGEIDFAWYLRRSKRLRYESYTSLARALGRRFEALLNRWRTAIRERRERRRAIAELLNLDDRSLRDLGLNRTLVYFAVDHGREDSPAPANDMRGHPPKVA